MHMSPFRRLFTTTIYVLSGFVSWHQVPRLLRPWVPIQAIQL